MKKLVFAVDFDGTIVKHDFPRMGKELPGAVQTLKDLQSEGHQIVIWTCRCGYALVEALEWLQHRDFTPDAANANVIYAKGFAIPKIYADYYLDDRSFPPFTNWEAVRAAFLYGEKSKDIHRGTEH